MGTGLSVLSEERDEGTEVGHCWLNVFHHPGFIEQVFSIHSQKCHVVLSSDHGYFEFCLEIMLSNFFEKCFIHCCF